jgi:cap2 methyltransferase
MKIYRLGTHKKEIKICINDNNFELNNKTIFESKKQLTDKKCEIDKCKPNEWEIAKKKTNDYEYIYTSSKKEKNICSIQPVSRSYFKIYQMIKDIPSLIKENTYNACLAEGPGGFIHCLNDIQNDYNFKKNYGITLISYDKNIPYWNQQILINKNNYISRGFDNTGNIYSIKNVKHFINEVGDNKCNLVTADGGFDYSNDYNVQEDISYNLLYCEIFTALNIQCCSGNFIIKLFDLFNYRTVQLIYLLYCHYSNLEFYKPSLSRNSNSEKYLICSGFSGCSKYLLKVLEEYYNDFDNLFLEIPQSFIDEINHYNTTFTKQQIESIDNNLDLIKKQKLNKTPSSNQLDIAKKWCEIYNLKINENCIYL